MKTFFSTHTGAGGADVGAKQAGLTLVGGIEIDPYAVGVYRHNFGGDIRHESVLDTQVSDLPDFDFLWSSPPCPSFSVAKHNRKETDEDISQAKKIAEIIRKKAPQYFALENVRGYAKSDSFRLILETLWNCKYGFKWEVHDAADFGVPQNRCRLILRASRVSLGDLVPTHSTHNGWYGAVEDLLPSCELSSLTERQIEASRKPPMTLCASMSSTSHLPKAVLISGASNFYGASYTTRADVEPCFTITANLDRNVTRAVLSDATVLALNVPCVARLQSFPDNYEWGDKRAKNLRCIGNAAAPLFVQQVIKSMVDCTASSL